jgi:hypothetical protein
MKKYVVPEGMRKAAYDAYSQARHDGMHLQAALEAAIQWLSENPIWPTSWQSKKYGIVSPYSASAWQEHMFEAPEPLPDEVVALCGSVPKQFSNEIYVQWRDAILKAYELGKKEPK